MQAKEYMIRVRKAEQELRTLAARRSHYLDLMQSMCSDPAADRVQHGISSKTENVAIGLASLAEKMAQRSAEYAQIVTEAEELIAKIPQQMFRDVLTYRYLCGMSWRTIRDVMGYKDEKSVYRCHGYALKELQNLL